MLPEAYSSARRAPLHSSIQWETEELQAMRWLANAGGNWQRVSHVRECEDSSVRRCVRVNCKRREFTASILGHEELI